MTTLDFHPAPSPRRGAMILAIGFALFASVALGLSAADAYLRIHPNAFPATIMAANIGLVLAYFLVPSINALGRAMGPYHLAYFHIWRIFAGAVFLAYGASGALPALFAERAGYGDILAGLIAAALLILPRRTRFVLGFHVVGFTDLALVIATGIYLNTTAPTTMDTIAYLPLALIPLVGVPLSIMSHVAAFDQIARGWRA